MEVRDLWPAIFVDLGVIRNRAVIRALEVWEMSLYRTATRIVTVTESFRQNLLQRGISPEKVVTITNGADTVYWRPGPDRAAELRNQLGLQGEFVVLYIGAHGISQGLSAVIKVANRVRDQIGIRFLFVGDGAEKGKLVAEVRRLGLTNVTFLEPVDKAQVRDYYSMADLCLVPLRNIPLFDAFIPSKMFEIMAVGRPILASVRGEAAEILRRSASARVTEPENEADMAEALLNLRKSPATRQEMGRQGRKFVEAYYSRRELARRYLEVIRAAREAMGLEDLP
jgi:glycosyltransferase involved in cell wall biosynthesis